jgi:protoporphyrinogen/coproporphyrinogen III oxidase
MWHYAVHRQACRPPQSTGPSASNGAEFVELHRWFQENNQVGFYRDLGRFRALCEHDHRLQLAGDFYSMQNLDAATTCLRAAQRLMPYLGD